MRDKLKEYFKIEELVSKQVLWKYGEERSWLFFDPRLLELLLWVRVTLNKPITVNNWSFGGAFSQRGLRENTCNIVKSKVLNNQTYLSAHVLGMAVDFDVKGMTAQEVRDWLKDKKAPKYWLHQGGEESIESYNNFLKRSGNIDKCIDFLDNQLDSSLFK